MPFTTSFPPFRPLLATAAVALVLLTSACSGTGAPESGASSSATSEVTGSATATASSAVSLGPTTGDCATTAATFRDVVSANADLADPELAATCEDGSLVVTSNSIPDFAYVATTPGAPRVSEATYTLPVTPSEAADPSPDDVPRLGAIGVAVNGVPIYGPTEGTGGDVLSLGGALSVCGSHAGPVDFHMHLAGYAAGVDCLYSEAEITSGDPIVVGWAADGYPIMSGVVCADEACTSTRQLTSSWELTDESQFATDTWAAHSFVEGSGDLDQCNGRVDADGQYRYYTTETFPYVIGCFHGEVSSDALPAGGGGAPAAPPANQ